MSADNRQVNEENFARPIVKIQGTVTIPQTFTQWVWRCEICGWLGLGHTSEFAAVKEAADHYWNDHHLALCAPQEFGHAGHDWKHVPGSDSLSKCQRCEWVIGK